MPVASAMKGRDRDISEGGGKRRLCIRDHKPYSYGQAGVKNRNGHSRKVGVASCSSRGLTGLDILDLVARSRQNTRPLRITSTQGQPLASSYEELCASQHLDKDRLGCFGS
jgi:hypothetical protein